MPKLKLLILDAGVVIQLHELQLWQPLLVSCDVHLSRIVAEREVFLNRTKTAVTVMKSIFVQMFQRDELTSLKSLPRT